MASSYMTFSIPNEMKDFISNRPNPNGGHYPAGTFLRMLIMREIVRPMTQREYNDMNAACATLSQRGANMQTVLANHVRIFRKNKREPIEEQVVEDDVLSLEEIMSASRVEEPEEFDDVEEFEPVKPKGKKTRKRIVTNA